MRASVDPDPLVRVAALGSFHRLDSLNDLRLSPFLNDPDARVRRRAIELAPRATNGHELVPAVIERLADEPVVAEMAAFALGELEDPRAVPALEAMALDHDEPLCREAAVAALGAIGQGKATILAALGDKATVRRRAVIALAPFDGPDVEAALRSALEDRDWQVRQAAEDLLAD